MEIKTKSQLVSAKMHIWAVPRSAHEIKRDGGELFKYELKDTGTYHWVTGAICLHSGDVSLALPGGIDMVAKTFETLDTAKKEAQAECARKVAEIDEQIKSMLLLTGPQHNPDDLVYEAATDHINVEVVGDFGDDSEPF